jgi:hypothetical protein
MPSPFPGMDPYLEDLSWMNFHNQFCAEIARQLGPKVRPRYLARLTERYFSEIALEADEPERLSYPDVSVTESAPGPGRGGAVAVATVAAPVRVLMPSRTTDLIRPRPSPRPRRGRSITSARARTRRSRP